MLLRIALRGGSSVYACTPGYPDRFYPHNRKSLLPPVTTFHYRYWEKLSKERGRFLAASISKMPPKEMQGGSHTILIENKLAERVAAIRNKQATHATSSVVASPVPACWPLLRRDELQHVPYMYMYARYLTCQAAVECLGHVKAEIGCCCCDAAMLRYQKRSFYGLLLIFFAGSCCLFLDVFPMSSTRMDRIPVA